MVGRCAEFVAARATYLVVDAAIQDASPGGGEKW